MCVLFKDFDRYRTTARRPLRFLPRSALGVDVYWWARNSDETYLHESIWVFFCGEGVRVGDTHRTHLLLVDLGEHSTSPRIVFNPYVKCSSYYYFFGKCTFYNSDKTFCLKNYRFHCLPPSQNLVPNPSLSLPFRYGSDSAECGQRVFGGVYPKRPFKTAVKQNLLTIRH